LYEDLIVVLLRSGVKEIPASASVRNYRAQLTDSKTVTSLLLAFYFKAVQFIPSDWLPYQFQVLQLNDQIEINFTKASAIYTMSMKHQISFNLVAVFGEDHPYIKCQSNCPVQ